MAGSAHARNTSPDRSSVVRALGRVSLGVFLVGAGIGHFVAPEAFLAQVPSWLPARTFLVYASGVVEIALGTALLVLHRPRHRRTVGVLTALFFVVIFPGNVHQAVAAIDAFGLDSPTARWTRLAFQPLLVVWALWATDALRGVSAGWAGRPRSAGRR